MYNRKILAESMVLDLKFKFKTALLLLNISVLEISTANIFEWTYTNFVLYPSL